MVPTEIEVKFLVNYSEDLLSRISHIGSALVVPRVKETNFRFDTPDLKFTRAGQVIRLREDLRSRLTYKGVSQDQEGVRVRTEIEFDVSDSRAARLFLEALGYEILLIYEKYRTTYEMDDIQIVYDELPYGNFLEIEGPDPTKIKKVADSLGLNWEARIIQSYSVIFEMLKGNYQLGFRDLVFENFDNLNLSLESLGFIPANAP